MKKILYSAMPMDNGKSGISNYIFNTLDEFLKENKVSVMVLKKDLHLLAKRFPSAEYIIVPDHYSKPLQNMLWHLFIMPFSIDFSRFDFLFIPAANRRIICRRPIFSIGTVHDFSQLHVSAKYDLFRMFYIKKLIPFFLHKFDSIVSVSESTKKDLLGYCRIPVDKIKVLYNGYDRRLYNDKFAPDTGIIREKIGIKGKYILYISRIEHPGKNHLNLMKAYEMLPPKLRDEYNLVLAGSSWSGAEKVIEYAEKSSVRDRIIFTGFVEYGDLPQLYRCASLYAFPSFFEGFGIPLVEAMACSVPCVCSNCSSLAELAEGAALTFDPHRPEDIAEKMQTVLEDSSLASELSRNGLKRISAFSWEKHVKGIMEIYDSRTKGK